MYILVNYTMLQNEYCANAISALTVCMSYICNSDQFTVQRWHTGVKNIQDYFTLRHISLINNTTENSIPHFPFMLQFYDPRHTVPHS